MADDAPDPGRPVPEHDALADAARGALHHLARAAPGLPRTWAEVEAAARVRRRQRIAVAAAAVLVLVGAGAALAATAGGRGARLRVAGHATTTSSSTPASSSTTTSSATVPLTGPVGPGTPTTAPPAPTSTPVLQPQDGSWSSAVSVDPAVVTAGDVLTVRLALTNTGTQPQQTEGYASYGVACAAYPYTDVRDGLPAGEFLPFAVLQPGETRSFTISFRTEASWVGSLRCGSGYAFHGDAFAAGPGADAVTVEVVVRGATTTTTATATTTSAP